MNFLKRMGNLKNNHPALKASIGYEKLSYIKTNLEDKILAFERTNKGDTIVFVANFSNNHCQFRMNYNNDFKSFPKGTKKILSSTYEYVMKPWEFWILIK